MRSLIHSQRHGFRRSGIKLSGLFLSLCHAVFSIGLGRLAVIAAFGWAATMGKKKKSDTEKRGGRGGCDIFTVFHWRIIWASMWMRWTMWITFAGVAFVSILIILKMLPRKLIPIAAMA